LCHAPHQSRWLTIEGPPCAIFAFPADPAEATDWQLKVAKKSELKELAASRGLPTDGAKAVLLERIRTQLRFARFQVDGRECLQRVLAVGLFHIEHPLDRFVATLPLRGPCTHGGLTLDELYDNPRVVDMVDMARIHGSDPTAWSPRASKTWDELVKGGIPESALLKVSVQRAHRVCATDSVVLSAFECV
jgi:hypothetical protein